MTRAHVRWRGTLRYAIAAPVDRKGFVASSKRQTTMAKIQREQRVREKRPPKAAEQTLLAQEPEEEENDAE
jgi:hypothetical protein